MVEANCAILNYENHTVKVKSPEGKRSSTIKVVKVLDEPPKKKGLLSAMQVKKALKRGAKCFFVVVKKSDDGSAQATGMDDPDIAHILEEYADVFQDIPVGLPPERNTVHTIPLEPGTKPIFKQMYRLSPLNTKKWKDK